MGNQEQDIATGTTEDKSGSKVPSRAAGRQTAPKPMYDTRVPDAIDAFLFVSLAIGFAVAAAVTLYLVVALGSLPWLVVLVLASVAVWEVARLLIDGDLGRKPTAGAAA